MMQDRFPPLGKEGLEAATRALGTVARGGQVFVQNSQALMQSSGAIAAELAEFGRQTVEQGTAALGRLTAARSLETVMEIQGEFAKASYEGLVARSARIGELCTALARDAVKPFEQAAAGAATLPAA